MRPAEIDACRELAKILYPLDRPEEANSANHSIQRLVFDLLVVAAKTGMSRSELRSLIVASEHAETKKILSAHSRDSAYSAGKMEELRNAGVLLFFLSS